MATLRLVPATGNPIEVTQASVLLGRDPACDVVLADGSVSRKHARLEERDNQWFVVDQGSANGTFLDSVRATDTPMRHGQEIRFGAVSFRIEIVTGDTGATVLTEPVATVLQPPGPTVPTPAAPAPPPPPPPPPALGGPPPPPPPPGLRPGPPRSPVTAPPLVPKPMKKRRGPGFWVGLGCCGCLAMLLLAAGAFFGLMRMATGPAAEVAEQHLAHIREGDLDAAWEQFSPALQQELPLLAFAALVAAHPTLNSNSEATLNSRAWSNGVVTLGYGLTATSGEQGRITYRLVKDEDRWRIIWLRIGEPEP